MSDVVSPDAPTTGSEEAQTGGKVSLMDKVKAKAKTGTKKLKAKLNKGPDSGTPTEGAAGEDSSSASSSDEEEETPVNNAVSGMTQPDYEKKLNEGDPAVTAGANSAATQGSPCVPSTNFPGDFEGTVGAKETELSKDFEGLSTEDKAPASESESTGADKPVTEKATDSLYAAKDEATEKVGSEKPVTEKATDSLYAAKDQAAEKFGSDETSGGASVTDSLPEQVKPSEETKQATTGYYNKAAGAATDYYNVAAEKASQLTGKTQETAKDVSESGSTGEVADKAADAGKSWSQWAAEKVGYGKDVAAEKLPATEDGTSAPDAAIGKATEAKDVVSQKAGEVADTASAKAGEYQSSIPSDPAQRTYTQQAVTHATTTKDSLIASSKPSEHDKALSEKVTESIGNLPSILKSSLGLGGSTPTTHPTDPSVTGADAAAPQSPSLVGRFTSMFTEKKPTSSESSTATKEETSK